MRKIFLPILSVLVITSIMSLGSTGCTGCTSTSDSDTVVTDTIDTTVVSLAEKPVELTCVVTDGARRSVEVQPLDNPDTTYLFEYPEELDEQSRTSWEVGDTIVITYFKRGNDTESDSIVKISKK